MRWRQVVLLTLILMSVNIFTVSCENGVRRDPNPFQFIDSRRDP